MNECGSPTVNQDWLPGCPPPEWEPLGVIQEIQGPVIDVVCSRLPPLHRAIYVCLNGEHYTFEVHRHLDEQRVRAIALHRTSGLKRQMTVFDGGVGLQIPVTPDCLGRLLDMFGRPLDGGPPLIAESFRPIVAPPVSLSGRLAWAVCCRRGSRSSICCVRSFAEARPDCSAVPGLARRY